MTYFLGVFVFFAVIILFSLALAQLLKQNVACTAATACYAVVLILYLFALAGLLYAGVFAVLAAALAALIYLVFLLCKRRVNFGGLLRSPGLWALLICCLFVCWINMGRMLTFWDEFSHWGLVVKNMVLGDSFGNFAGATTSFAEYPPASSLFSYFACKLTGGDTAAGTLVQAESMQCIAMSMLLITPSLRVLSRKGNQRVTVPRVLIWVTALLLPMLIFQNFFSSLYVDALLGISFAHLLLCHFASPQPRSKADIIHIGAVAAFLSLKIGRAHV